MRALEFITGHVIYNPTYTYKFQLKTTLKTRQPVLTYCRGLLYKSPCCSLDLSNLKNLQTDFSNLLQSILVIEMSFICFHFPPLKLTPPAEGREGGGL